ncbi:hypothetical protein BDN72DRAFT_963549 [Pluteus cervinus]|uniref:Uncharacterized protein n=1 Tax=Pluteus cervinus TaxID=181527 RepID=A0ACD3AGJ7_9AGAR|nr:hypothetical protein BDN72DRAFT_963549 [Pluteus cervinus]
MGALGQVLSSWFSVDLPGAPDASKSRLLTLPPELLTGIVQELSWQDLLRIRPTCRLLDEVSKSSPVWRNIARLELLDDCTTGANELFFDRPVEQYKLGELERLILRWKQAKQNWTADNGIPPAFRTFKINVERVHLVRGGRWLLFARRTGSIVYLDLDASGPPVEHILIPERTGSSDTTMALDYIPNSNVLTFNVALAVRQFPGEREKTGVTYTIQVWRVRLSLRDDGAGLADRLSAGCLVSFCQDPQCFVYSISILGDYIAHTLLSKGDYKDFSFIVVTKWVDLIDMEGGCNYTKWSHYSRLKWRSIVYLLPGHQLLVYADGAIQLYDFFRFPESKALPTRPDRSSWSDPLWKTFIDGADLFPAPPMISGPDFVRMVIFANTGFRGLTIYSPNRQAERESPASICELGECPGLEPLYPAPSYGHRYSTLMTGSQLTLVSHPWPDGSEGKFRYLGKITCHKGQGLDRLFDMMSGRIVIVNRTIDILDLAPMNAFGAGQRIA